MSRVLTFASALYLFAAPFTSFASPPASSPATERALRSEIILVSEDPAAEQLLKLIEELLSQHGIESTVSRRARFDPSALLDAADTDVVRVFIGLDGATRARLFVRGPSGQRFLLRQVALEHGLDAVGRELIAQVVESAVETLSASSDSGLTRAQASAELGRESARSTAPPVAPPPVTPRLNDARASRPPRRRPALSLELGAGYVASYAGPELDVAQGLALELAAGVGYRGRWLRVRVEAERFLPQQLHVSELAASLQTTSARAGLELGQRFNAAHALALTFTAGADWTRVQPGAARVAGFKPAAPHSATGVALRPGLRYELRHAPWFVAFAQFLDVPLAVTHFDLRDAQGQHRRATPWRVHPAAALSFGACW